MTTTKSTNAQAVNDRLYELRVAAYEDLISAKERLANRNQWSASDFKRLADAMAWADIWNETGTVTVENLKESQGRVNRLLTTVIITGGSVFDLAHQASAHNAAVLWLLSVDSVLLAHGVSAS